MGYDQVLKVLQDGVSTLADSGGTIIVDTLHSSGGTGIVDTLHSLGGAAFSGGTIIVDTLSLVNTLYGFEVLNGDKVILSYRLLANAKDQMIVFIRGDLPKESFILVEGEDFNREVKNHLRGQLSQINRTSTWHKK